MDAQKLFGMIKPHLDHLDNSERILLSNLIAASRPEKITCHHRKVHPVSKAKEFLNKFRQKEMEREQKERTSL